MKAIEFKDITKTFLNGKLIANNKISFAIEKGKIHALAGENGAGKSTLLSILFGILKQDFGKIYVYNKEVSFKSAIDAINSNIGMVQQHFQLVDKFTIGENILLGFEKNNQNIFINFKKEYQKINEIAKKYNFNLKASDLVKNLTVDKKQKVEILKLLYKDLDILIFDEPTAMLAPKEIDSLLEVFLQLKKQGKTIIFITHKLEEIKKISDHVTIMRKGQIIDTVKLQDISIKKLANLLVGEDVGQIKKTAKVNNQNILEVKNLSYKKQGIKRLKNISFEIKKGEILAIAGVGGNGQTELVDILVGTKKPDKNSKIVFKGESLIKKNIKKRIDLGISHIPEDRHRDGLILDAKIYENMIMKVFDRYDFSKFGILKKNKLRNYAIKIFEKFDVRGTDSGKAIARNLSGGNQQKAIVGREYILKNDLLISFQATRGLDIKAINLIHNLFLKSKNKNRSVLLISYDINEIIDLADRVIVLSDGKITGELKGKNINREKIGILMAK